MRIKFHKNLDELKQQLLVMADLVERAIDLVIAAYGNGDKTLCEEVLQGEPAINRMEREIDQLALDLLATEQPMAIDLRFIISVIRINADLERVGDQAVNIANRIREISTAEHHRLEVDIAKLGGLSSAMVRRALQSFIDADATLAYSVLTMDDEVDRINADAFTALGAQIGDHPQLTMQALNALIITRNFERIGDHATNIAEDVIFWVQGADVRHNMLRT
jgi:phosphate transport system protein